MSNRRHTQESENIYSSACIQALEQEYCSSCSAVVVSSCIVSSQGLGARLVSRIYNGGRQAIYTATVGAMLVNNTLPVYGGTRTVPSGTTSTGIVLSGTESDPDILDVYGNTVSTQVNDYGMEQIYSGGTASKTLINVYGSQIVYSGAETSGVVISGGAQVVSQGTIHGTVLSNAGGAGGYITVSGAMDPNLYDPSKIGVAGFAYDTVIDGGWQEIRLGAVASNTIIRAPYGHMTGYGSQWVDTHAIAYDTVVSSGAAQEVLTGGRTYRTIVSSGGTQGLYTNAKLTSDPFKAKSFDTQVLTGGIQIVHGRSYSSDTKVFSGGSQAVEGAVHSVATASGWATLGAPASAYNTVLSSGGVQILSGVSSAVSAGLQSGTIVSGDAFAYNTVISAGGSQVILEGGSSISASLLSGGSQIISSGGEAWYTSLYSEADQYLKGGSAISNVISGSGAIQYVESDGAAYDTVINAGGSQVVRVSGYTSGVQVNSGGTQIAYSSGVVQDTTVFNGGRQLISSGGTARGTVLSGGSQEIFDGGVASTAAVSSGGVQFISNGGTADSTTVFAQGSQVVLYGGTANNTTISSGGEQFVSSGGMANSTTVMEGGIKHLENGAIIDGDVISSGGEEYVSSGSITSDVEISAGGSQVVLYSGSAIHTIVNSGGQQVISSGGYAGGTEISGAGSQIISDGGLASMTQVRSNGVQFISNGGSADYTTVFAQGSQVVLYGGTANNTTISSGGEQFVSSGGMANSTTVMEGGIKHLENGAIIDGDVISSGGSEYVSSGAITYDVEVNSGGFQVVLSSGSAIHTIVNSSGYQTVSNGGYAGSTVVNMLGSQIVSDGGLADSTTVISYGNQFVSSGGVASNTVLSNGYQTVYYGGVAKDTTISAGGHQHVSRGVISNTTAIGGDTLSQRAGIYISGGSAVSTTLTGGSAYLSLDEGSVADFTVLDPTYDATLTVAPTAVVNDTLVRRGLQVISQGATANRTVLSGSGAVEWMYGQANSTIVDGGYQNVESTGLATDTLIRAGVQHLRGSALRTLVAGGSQLVSAGATAQDTVISGGSQEVYGTALGTTLNGGSQVVWTDGVASDTVISGGTQEVLNGALAQSTRIYGGTQLVSGSAVDTTLYGGVQQVDIFASVSNVTLSGGTQEVLGSVDDVVISAGSQVVSSGGLARGTVLSGGTQQVYGSVNSTTINGGTQTVFTGAAAHNTVLQDGALDIYAGASIDALQATGGSIHMIGANQWEGNTVLGPTAVHFIHPEGVNDYTLTADNLSADGTTFHMNVDLQNHTGDKLSITSSYTGNALLSLTNVADGVSKNTPQDGIKLVEFGSGATVEGTFDLPGGKWDQGALEYKLIQGTAAGEGQDYYLRKVGDYTNVYKTMLNIPALNVAMARAGMNSLQKRLGELRYMGNETKKHGVWARVYYKDTTVKELMDIDMKLAGVEAGQDWLLFPYDPTKLYVGGMVGYVDATSIRSHNVEGSYSKGDGYAPSIGAYATLMNDNLWFVDLAVRDFFTRTDMKSYTAGGTVLEYTPKRNVLAWSVEAGKTVERRLSARSWWHITPKVELTNMYAFKSSAHVSNGVSDLEYGKTTYLSGKIGVQVEYSYLRPNGLLISPILDLGYAYEFAGETNLSYGGVQDKVSAKGGMFEADLGLNMQLTPQLYWYLLGSYEGGEKFTAWGGHAGIRFMFGNQPAKNKTYADSQSSTYTKRMVPQEEVTYQIPIAQTQKTQPEETTHYVYPGKNSANKLNAHDAQMVESMDPDYIYPTVNAASQTGNLASQAGGLQEDAVYYIPAPEGRKAEGEKTHYVYPTGDSSGIVIPLGKRDEPLLDYEMKQPVVDEEVVSVVTVTEESSPDLAKVVAGARYGTKPKRKMYR